jgi:hypothetical protein
MNKILILFLIITISACSKSGLKNKYQENEVKTSLISNPDGKGPVIVIDFTKGESFYYPLLAIWLEDTTGKYIQTLYVARSAGTGVFKYAMQENNKWVTASKRAPQTLPYWAHKRGIKAADGLYMPDVQTSVPDAYSGATPVNSFFLTAHADSLLPEKYKILLEINQNWDWNEFWTNDKFPDDENYKMSCQPAIVYEAVIDTRISTSSFKMYPIGHGHYSGKTGELFTDLTTITTALDIVGSVTIFIR